MKIVYLSLMHTLQFPASAAPHRRLNGWTDRLCKKQLRVQVDQIKYHQDIFTRFRFSFSRKVQVSVRSFRSHLSLCSFLFLLLKCSSYNFRLSCSFSLYCLCSHPCKYILVMNCTKVMTYILVNLTQYSFRHFIFIYV